jgi:formylmethanofuran dehydrogenase subunit E
MKKQILILGLLPVIVILAVVKISAHDDETSAAGSNIWNQVQEPTNWWDAIKQVHGHVGPWNVLGWRMGKAALRELGATWGEHQLDIICHIPIKTPYSCIADGLVVGTGNSIGRLDIRLAEAMTMAEIYVGVRRKDGSGPVLLLKPNQEYLGKIRHAPDDQLESLARKCGELPEAELFTIEKVPPSETNSR